MTTKCLICDKEINSLFAYNRCCSIYWHKNKASFPKYINGSLYIFDYYYDNKFLVGESRKYGNKISVNMEIDFKNLDKIFLKITRFIIFS